MNKGTLIRYAAALFFTVALASCNKEDADLPGSGNGGGEISFEIGFGVSRHTGSAGSEDFSRASYSSTPGTRAATDVDFNSVWEDGDEIGVFAVASGQSLTAEAQKNHIHNAKLSYNNGTWTQETALYWPTGSGNTSLDFYAYYPYDAAATDPTAIAFNVMADQSGTTDRGGEDIPNYNLCDLLTASTTGTARGAVVNLTFSHALAMVQVTVDPAGVAAVDPAEVSVTLRGVKTGATLDLGAASGPAAVAVVSDNDAAGIKMYRLEQPLSEQYAKTFTFRALVPAQTVVAGTSLFRIGCGGELFGSEALAGDHILKAGEVELFGQAPVYDDYALRIPDATFRAYCLDNFDTDGDGKLSRAEIEAVSIISVSYGYNGTKIQSLEGIKYFRNLQTLECNNNSLSSLDVSGCGNLQTLYCYNNSLTSLDASGCGNLQTLNCIYNSLTSLDVTGCENLQSLDCQNNSLTSLDVTGCENLQSLDCDHNSLTSLNVSDCRNLQSLNCRDNSLESLDVSDCANLQSLNCNYNSLTSLDVKGCENLQTLYCYNNSLTLLDLSGCGNLQTLNCGANSLTSLDVSDCRNLQALSCNDNSLTSLDLSGCGNLQELNCNDNSLTSLDVSGCRNLQTVFCNYNSLTSLDVTGFGNLQSLDCYNNPLTELDVSENSALQLLRCGDRGATNLIVWTSHAQQLSTSQTPGYLYVAATYGSGGITFFEAISQKGETKYGVIVKDKQ